MVSLLQNSDSSIMYNPDLQHRLMIAGWKEAMRNLEKVGVYQAYMTFSQETVFKPVVIVSH